MKRIIIAFLLTTTLVDARLYKVGNREIYISEVCISGLSYNILFGGRNGEIKGISQVFIPGVSRHLPPQPKECK